MATELEGAPTRISARSVLHCTLITNWMFPHKKRVSVLPQDFKREEPETSVFPSLWLAQCQHRGTCWIFEMYLETCSCFYWEACQKTLPNHYILKKEQSHSRHFWCILAGTRVFPALCTAFCNFVWCYFLP